MTIYAVVRDGHLIPEEPVPFREGERVPVTLPEANPPEPASEPAPESFPNAPKGQWTPAGGFIPDRTPEEIRAADEQLVASLQKASKEANPNFVWDRDLCYDE